MNTHEYFQPGIGYLSLCPRCAFLRGYGRGFLTKLDETPGVHCMKCSHEVMLEASELQRDASKPVWERPCEEIFREDLLERQSPFNTHLRS